MGTGCQGADDQMGGCARRKVGQCSFRRAVSPALSGGVDPSASMCDEGFWGARIAMWSLPVRECLLRGLL